MNGEYLFLLVNGDWVGAAGVLVAVDCKEFKKTGERFSPLAKGRFSLALGRLLKEGEYCSSSSTFGRPRNTICAGGAIIRRISRTCGWC
jgi:hypothetical protein